MKQNVIQVKSYAFALKAIRAYTHLRDQKEFVLSNQFIRSSTSIGANVEEALQGESRKDFIHKLSIAQKESFEAGYWIRLLKDSEYLQIEVADELTNDCVELQRIITAILKTTKCTN